MNAAILAIGLGAGLASALLFSVMITGSALAFVLSYVSPLPILIACLGWSHRAGLVAALGGALMLAIAFHPSTGLAFAAGLGLPAWWLGYLALLGRQQPDGSMEWYPLGRLLAWIAATGALVTLVWAISVGPSFGEYESRMRALIMEMVKAGDARTGLPSGTSEDDIVTLILAWLPVMTAASFAPMQAINLWLAGKAVAASGRLPRPWPSIPDTELPFIALAVFLVSIALGWFGAGYVALAGRAATGALTGVLALQGLAAVHRVTRGKAIRPLVLSTLYLLLFILFVWMIPVLAGIGFADRLLHGRRARADGPPTPPVSS